MNKISQRGRLDMCGNFMYISMKLRRGVHVFCWEVGVFNHSCFCSASCKLVMFISRINLATEMFNFVAKEDVHSNKLLEFLKVQREYHQKALDEIGKSYTKNE